jgi:hypothetical protein
MYTGKYIRIPPVLSGKIHPLSLGENLKGLVFRRETEKISFGGRVLLQK